jgi:hypothetical protein
MPEIPLDRADRTVAAALRERPVDPGQRLDLDRITDRRGGAVCLDVTDGRRVDVADPQGLGFVIVKVTKIVPGNANLQPALISRTQTEFQQTAGTEYAEQMARAIQADVGVKRDDAAIGAAKRRIIGGGN